VTPELVNNVASWGWKPTATPAVSEGLCKLQASELDRTRAVSFHFLESRKDAEYNLNNNHEIKKSPKMIKLMYVLLHLRVNVPPHIYMFLASLANTSRDYFIIRPFSP
jgi:hypothetical protein